MPQENLRERMLDHESKTDFKLTKKLPIVININGRAFRKTTSLLTKPYCQDFTTIMGQTLIKLASEIDGAIFLYSFNDEINIVCRNDQNLETEAWYDNNIQKIASATSSIATCAFMTSSGKSKMELVGDPIFISKVFIIPSIQETINYLIAKQHQASHTAIYMACFYELLKDNSSSKTLQTLKNLNLEEKYDLLVHDYGIDLGDYPLAFWRGIACYRTHKTINTDRGPESRFKLTIDESLPFFNKDQSFLANLLRK